jgi:hypothetical protein
MVADVGAVAVNELPSRRLAAAMGVAIAAAVAVWWLGSARLALEGGSDAARSSAQALHAAWLARGMALAMLTVRVGAWHGWRPGAAAALALIAPSWPVVVLAWSATASPLTSIVLSECLLLAAGFALPLIGLALRRALARAELADLLAAGVGAALAAVTWSTHARWAPLD